jgi:hypothetical protein
MRHAFSCEHFPWPAACRRPESAPCCRQSPTLTHACMPGRRLARLSLARPSPPLPAA